jgi:hypothetical protein
MTTYAFANNQGLGQAIHAGFSAGDKKHIATIIGKESHYTTLNDSFDRKQRETVLRASDTLYNMGTNNSGLTLDFAGITAAVGALKLSATANDPITTKPGEFSALAPTEYVKHAKGMVTALSPLWEQGIDGDLDLLGTGKITWHMKKNKGGDSSTEIGIGFKQDEKDIDKESNKVSLGRGFRRRTGFYMNFDPTEKAFAESKLSNYKPHDRWIVFVLQTLDIIRDASKGESDAIVSKIEKEANTHLGQPGGDIAFAAAVNGWT